MTRRNLASWLWGSSKRLAAVQACGLQPWLLDTQYRMHPAIAEFPSRLFYKGRIQTGLSPEERPLPPGAPQPASFETRHHLLCCSNLMLQPGVV